MADDTYKVPENPVYDPEIREIQDEDPVRASTILTPVMEQIIGNIHATHLAAEKAQNAAEAAGADAAQAVSDAEKGAPGGVATLDEESKVPAEQLPDMDYDAAGSAQVVQKALDTHTANQNNPHKVTKTHVGLENVDNTSDMDKPISTAQMNKIDEVRTIAQNAKAAAEDAKEQTSSISLAQLGIAFGSCATVAGTTDKVCEAEGFQLVTGARVAVYFNNENTAASPTLNVNSTGAKAIRYKGAAPPRYFLASKSTVTFCYDGTYWQIESVGQGKVYTVDIPTSSWTTAATGYTKSVTVTGIASNMIPVIDVVLSDNVSEAKLQLEAFSCIDRITTGTNTITLYCYDAKPISSFTLQLVLGGGF